MPDIQPLHHYQDALDYYSQGETDKASQALAEALGTETASVVIKDSLGKLLKKGTLANDAILTVLATEIAKRRVHDRE